MTRHLFRKTVRLVMFCLAAAILANGQAVSQQVRIPVKAEAWLSPLHLNPQASQDPLATFQAWRRANRVTLPATPAVWQAHLSWLKLHPQVKPRLQQLEESRIRIAARAEMAGNSSLPGISSSGNIVPLTGLSSYQGEIAAAINPGNPFEMIAAANSFLSDPQCGGVSTQALYGSQDGGETWNYSCAPIPMRRICCWKSTRTRR
jgi:hypothetical protein